MVVIIGAGLAGLAAALVLQRAGRHCVVLDRLDRPGGLCGAIEWDGLEYSIGCNDFGEGLVTRSRALGVQADFRRVGSRFVVATRGRERSYELPLRFGSAASWLRRVPELLRLARALHRPDPAVTTLGEALSAIGASDELRSLGGLLGYPIGTPPAQLALDLLRAEMSRELGYRSDRSYVAEGGPQRLADALASRLRQLGGELRLSTEVRAHERDADGFIVRSSQGELRATQLITSEAPANVVPEGSLPGLEVATLRLRLRADAPLPKGLHTLAWIPDDADAWLGALHAGQQPERAGFHLFPCETAEHDNALAANLLFFAAPGASDAQLSARSEAILAGLGRLVPGIERSIDAHELVTPRGAIAGCGLSSRVIPFIVPPGWVKPDVFDAASGLYHVGNRVGPPGDHAGSAWLSGEWAAQRILAED